MRAWSFLAAWFTDTAARSSRRATKPRRRDRSSRAGRQAGLGLERLEAREVFDVEPGPEFVVNTSSGTNQSTSVSNAVASDADGNYVVVWQNYGQDGFGYGVFGQRFTSNGAKLGDEFQINTATGGNQYDAAVAMNSDGEFVVVWTDAGSGNTIAGQRYDANGQAVGDEFAVAPPNPFGNFGASVAINDSGEFVVSWSTRSYLLINTFTSIVAQQFDADGNAGAAFGIGLSHPLLIDKRSNVAMNAEGDFVVTWWDLDGVGGTDIFAQRYDAGDGVLGDSFTVNTFATGGQLAPDVAMNSDGEFVVVWQGPGSGDDALGVFGRRFAADGSALDATEFHINTTTTGSQTAPTVAMNETGGFVVAWNEDAGDGTYRVRAQLYASTGAGLWDEFLVNVNTLHSPGSPHLAYDDADRFVVAYTSDPDSGDSDVFARSFYANYAPTDMALSSSSVAEGTDVGALIGTLSTVDLSSQEEFTYSFVTNPGNLFALNGNAVRVGGVFNFEAGASHDLTVRVTDKDGNTYDETFTITVVNAPPAAPTDSNTAGNYVAVGAAGGASVGIVLASSDPAGGAVTYELTDDAGGRFQVDAATGEVTVVSGATFAPNTTYTIFARAFDGTDDGESSSFTISSEQIVRITGTSGNDTITVDFKNGVYTVKVNKVAWAETFTSVMRFEIYGLEGKDTIKIHESVLAPSYVDGGAGNDVIASGSGDDVLLGGDGNDTIKGGRGRNVLIGGLGKDSVQAASSSGASTDRSIMIGDSTTHDDDLAALLAISAAWKLDDAATVRTYLSEPTVSVDGQRDTLKSSKATNDLLFSFELKTSGARLDSLKTQVGDVVN